VSLLDQAWLHADESKRLMGLLEGGSGRTRFVGGCVRDGLLGLPVTDVDLATQLAPNEVMRRLKDAGHTVVPTGIDHGTVTVVINHQPFEVTSLRTDVSTDGRRATVAFTQDWREDAARRDFTMNALYADADGKVFDYFEGQADLSAGRVRFIGDPAQRIREDMLRILRFFRFRARFPGGALDAPGLAACIALAKGMQSLSRERIREEMLKILAATDPVPAVKEMFAHGILAPVLPDAVSAERLARLVPIEVALHASDPLRRLGSLFPADKAVLEAVGQRLRMSKAQQKRLQAMGVPLEPGQALGEALYWRGSDAVADQLLLNASDVSDSLAAQLREAKAYKRPPMPVSGKDFIVRGMPKGPAVSHAVRRFETAWVQAGCPRDAAALDRLMAESA
jgi:poly(A) polymerase